MSVIYLADTIGIDGTAYPTTGEHIRAIGEYKVPAIIAPPDNAQLKTIHTYYQKMKYLLSM